MMRSCFGACRLSTQVRLYIVIGISFSFVVAELVVGFSTQSLALVADAFHYTGDILSFVVALIAEKYSTCPDKNREGSYDKLPTLAAFFNSVFLVALGLGIFLQGVERFIHLQEISHPQLVLVMGCIGLFLNIVCVLILGPHDHGHGHGHSHGHGHGHGHAHSHSHNHSRAGDIEASTSPTTTASNLSMKAVLLHVAADAMNNLAVIVSAVIMWKVPAKHPEVIGNLAHEPKYYVDPACTVFIAMMIMVTTWPLVRQSGRELLGISEVEEISIELENRK